MTMIRKAGWVAMVVLASLVAMYAAVILMVPASNAPFLATRRAAMPLAVYAHLAGGLWALAVGPWQLNARLREQAVSRHRWLGRSYVVGVLLGGLGALALAPFAQTGTVASVGFSVLALLWIGFTLAAFLRIREGDRAAPRRRMIPSYAQTLAAVTLRIYLPVSLITGVPFETAYPAIAWLCWMPNLIAAEMIIARGADAVRV
jgi:hypothetical protein